MQFLKTLLIVFTVALAVAFAFNNWDVVPVRLWGGLIVDINLPLLMLLCFLAGLIPAWLWHYAVRWRLKQRLSSSERAVQDMRTVAVTPTPVVAADVEPVVMVSPAPTPAIAAAPPLIDDHRP